MRHRVEDDGLREEGCIDVHRNAFLCVDKSGDALAAASAEPLKTAWTKPGDQDPLRTAAMSSLVALCCVLIVRPAQPKGALASDPEAGSGRRETMLKI
mgnify:CR=1 FL=1